MNVGKQRKIQNTRQKKKTNEEVDERGIMNLEEWYFQTPIVTRCYLTMSFLITAGCALEVRF